MRHLQRECFAQVVEMKELEKKREQEDLIDRLYYEETVLLDIGFIRFSSLSDGRIGFGVSSLRC
jgi:hypothetical protein